MQNIIILGGSGFIGKNLVEYFINKKIKIFATYFKNPIKKNKYVKTIKCNLKNSSKVKKILKNKNIVINCAAVTSGSHDIVNNPHIHVIDNLKMNINILDSCKDNNIEHYIFLSCTSMYHQSKKYLSEKDFNINKINKKYFGVANMKIAVEKMCHFFSTISDIRFSIVRHSNIYGKYDKFDLKKSHFFGATVNKVLNSKKNLTIWGNGKEERDLLYIDDLIDFIIKIISKQKSNFEIFNCSYGKSFSITQIVKKIIKISHKKLKINYDLSKPTIPFSIRVNSKKANKLGWKPKHKIDEGIRKTINWCLKNEFL